MKSSTSDDSTPFTVVAELPQSLLTEIHEVVRELKIKNDYVKWSKSYHLTCGYIGRRPAHIVDKMTTALKKIDFSSITLHTPVVSFDPGRNAHQIWVSFDENEAFSKLRASISEATKMKAPPRSQIIPHVKLGEFKKSKNYIAIQSSVILTPIEIKTLLLVQGDQVLAKITA